MKKISSPISKEEILKLRAGDAVQLYGIAVTARDAALKFMVEKLIAGGQPLSPEDEKISQELQSALKGGIIYHSGPIVRLDAGKWHFVSAGPTTSARAEIYQDKVIAAWGVRAVIGKGGMGLRTLDACRKYGAVYVHAIGGAGVYNAERVAEVLDVFKKEAFGTPEAMWKIRLEGITGIVTMDAHGRSLHTELAKSFDDNMARLAGG
jgi:fumarate hydratase subunit beta